MKKLDNASILIRNIAIIIIYSMAVISVISLLLLIINEIHYAEIGAWILFYSLVSTGLLSLLSWLIHMRWKFLYNKINNIHLKFKK